MPLNTFKLLTFVAFFSHGHNAFFINIFAFSDEENFVNAFFLNFLSFFSFYLDRKKNFTINAHFDLT